MGDTNAHVVYGLRCPFWHSHACRWQARIRIPREQVCSGEGGLGVALVTPQYRAKMHKDHMCILEVTRDRSHVDHFGRQETRAHRAWVAAASQDSAMLCWSRKQIYKWLEDRVPGADVPGPTDAKNGANANAMPAPVPELELMCLWIRSPACGLWHSHSRSRQLQPRIISRLTKHTCARAGSSMTMACVLYSPLSTSC